VSHGLQGVAVAAKSLRDIASDGDRRKALEAMRDSLADRFDAAEGRDAATISKELREVMRELEELPTGKEVSTSDELAAKRKARIAAATAAERPAAGQ
ncbi:hypothetical protein ADL26_13805, partial [Thermoactinomyces vulgaris]